MQLQFFILPISLYYHCNENNFIFSLTKHQSKSWRKTHFNFEKQVKFLLVFFGKFLKICLPFFLVPIPLFSIESPKACDTDNWIVKWISWVLFNICIILFISFYNCTLYNYHYCFCITFLNIKMHICLLK